MGVVVKGERVEQRAAAGLHDTYVGTHIVDAGRREEDVTWHLNGNGLSSLRIYIGTLQLAPRETKVNRDVPSRTSKCWPNCLKPLNPKSTGWFMMKAYQGRDMKTSSWFRFRVLTAHAHSTFIASVAEKISSLR